MYELACCADVVVRCELCEVEVSLWYLAVAASAYGVGVVVGEGLLLDAGVEVENAFGVFLCGEFAEGDGLVVWSGGIFRLAYLYDGAAAVPAVGRIVFLPEGVGGRECDSVECGVLGPYAVVASRAVLEVVAVSVLHEFLPLGGHGGR